MSAVRVSYSGQAYSPAGEKGRFALPPLFRKAVKDASDGSRVLCLDKHPRWNCLIGFGLNRMAELQDQLDREYDIALNAGRDFDYDAKSNELFGFEQIPFDDSGRFVMPSFLARVGNVEDGLFFRGAGRFFTIWNPVELYAMGQEMDPAKVACETLVAEYEAKRK